MEPVKRQTAYLCSIKQIVEGEYVRREGWEPNFIASSIGALSRVRLVGFVLELQGNQFVLDDGTGKMPMRVFDSGVKFSFSVGDPLLVIGRPRVYGQEKYLLVEIAKKLPSASWLKYLSEQRAELAKYVPEAPKLSVKQEVAEQTVEEEQPVVEEMVVEKSSPNKAQILIDLIRELDPGDGALTSDILAKAGFSDAENKLQFLISEGEVFELRAGKVKVLE